MCRFQEGENRGLSQGQRRKSGGMPRQIYTVGGSLIQMVLQEVLGGGWVALS